MDFATEFSLDVQEMYQSGDVSREKFAAIVAKYGATKREDGIALDFADGSATLWAGVTLDFADGSAARWVEEESVWQLVAGKESRP